jgi:hypothetical protein
MHTEDDLRATFSALEHQAPDPVGTLAGLDRLRRRRTARRRVTGMVAVAAVTLALAGASLAARDLIGHTPPAGPTTTANRPAGQPLEFRFAIDDIPGFRTYYQIADPRFGHIAKVYASPNNEPPDSNAQPYDVNVFEAGKYDPTAARAGDPIDVRGKPGFYRPDMPCHCSGQSPIAGLAWESAPNTWALVQLTNHEGHPAAEVKANLIRIAAAVRFDKTTPVRVPFRIGWLPDGLRLASGTVFTWDPNHAGAILGLEPSTGDGPDLGVIALNDTHSSLPVGEPVVHDGLIDPGSVVVVNIGPFQVQLTSNGSRGMVTTPDNRKPGLTQEQLLRIARSITPAGDIRDPSTWIEASDAVAAS